MVSTPSTRRATNCRGRPAYLVDTERRLSVTSEFASGAATYRRREGIWTCIQADPDLWWLRGLSPAEARVELVRRRCDYEWLDPGGPPPTRRPCAPGEATGPNNSDNDTVAPTLCGVKDRVPPKEGFDA